MVTTFDAISEVDMCYLIRVLNGGMRKVIAKEVLGINGDVKEWDKMGILKLGESHRLGLSGMRGETQMPTDRLNGVVTFISTSPSLPIVMAVDKGDDEVTQEEVYMLSHVLSL